MTELTAPVVHLTSLLGALLVVAALLTAYPRRPSLRALLVATVAAVAAWQFSTMWGHHRCGNGNPFWQWFIPSAGIFAVVLFVDSKFARRSAALSFVVAACFLSADFAERVHGPLYIGVPQPYGVCSNLPISQWYTPVTGFYRRGERYELSPEWCKKVRAERVQRGQPPPN